MFCIFLNHIRVIKAIISACLYLDTRAGMIIPNKQIKFIRSHYDQPH